MGSGTEQSIGVVGGGIVGLAVARELLLRRPGATVEVLEAEDRVGRHQTGHNSGVVHAGIYYAPGSLKAELCTLGRLLLRDYCAEHRLPYVECGKLVLAVDAGEDQRFDRLEQTARANRVPGLRRLAADEIPSIEPNAVGRAALHSPRTAITDYVAIADALAGEIGRLGGSVRTSCPVTAIERRGGALAVTVLPRGGPRASSYHRFDRLVLCGGLQADRLARMAGDAAAPRIVPFRGDYLKVDPARQDLVRGMVYPVPDPRYPFLGVHFTRRVDGSLEIGPNAFLALSRRGYRRTSAHPADIAATLTWPGFWRFSSRHWRTGAAELGGVLSVRAYLRHARRYVPAIRTSDVVRHRSGLRAQAIDADGTMVDDFRITHADGVTSVRNAPSPAATSAFAIAGMVVDAFEREGDAR